MSKHVIHGLTLAAGLLLCAGAAVAGQAATGVELARNGDYQAAAEAFAAAHERAPRDAAIVAQLARVSLRLGQHEQGVAWAKKAVALAPDNARYRILLGDAYAQYVNDVSIFSKLGMAHDIRDAYLKAVQLAPDNPGAHARLAKFYRMAPGIAGGDDDKADRQIARVAELAPTKIAIMRAHKAYRDKDYAGAEKLLREAAATADDSRGYIALGQYFIRREQADQALAAFRKATRAFPDEPTAWYQIGKLAATGEADPQLGITAMQTYLGMRVDWRGNAPRCWAHYRLGQIRARMGDDTAARAEYRQALQLKPGFEQAQKALDGLSAS